MPRAASSSDSFFSVAGFSCGPLPSRSVEPEPAIKSATGGFSTPVGTFSVASIAPTRTALSSADALVQTSASSVNAAIARIRLVDLARLFRQHDRNAVADRISEFRGARDQLLTGGVELQRSLGQRADQDLQQFGIDGVFGAFHGLSPAIGDHALTYLARRARS